MKTIGNVREYFDEVVGYNLQQYKAEPTNLAAAFNLANALFHLHEWFWHDYETELKVMFGKNVISVNDFNSAVQKDCNAFKHIRDLANASKHVTLTQNPSTNATNITDTGVTGYGEGGYGTGGYGGGTVINDGGRNVNFNGVVNELYDYWRKLLMKLEA